VEERVEDHVLVVDGRRVVVQLVEVLGGSGSLVLVGWRGVVLGWLSPVGAADGWLVTALVDLGVAGRRVESGPWLDLGSAQTALVGVFAGRPDTDTGGGAGDGVVVLGDAGYGVTVGEGVAGSGALVWFEERTGGQWLARLTFPKVGAVLGVAAPAPVMGGAVLVVMAADRRVLGHALGLVDAARSLVAAQVPHRAGERGGGDA
jgi:hypothetical protein